MIDHQEHDAAKAGSERNFGIVFAGVFLVVALWPLVHGTSPRLWSLGVAVLFAGVTLARPALLRPLNLLWFRFGLLLSRIVAPVVMAVLFFVAVTPIALIFRLQKKDPLHCVRDPAARSYWVTRDEAIGSSMRNQF